MGTVINSIEGQSPIQERSSWQNLRPLTIGIDSGPLLGEGGISGYTRPLISTLLTDDIVSRYRLCLRKSWVSASAVSRLRRLAPVDTCLVPDRMLSWWWKHVGTPFPLGADVLKRVDVFFATCFMVPLLAKGKAVSIIYDLIPLRLPHLFPNHREIQAQLRETVSRSTALIAISHQTKQDLRELLGVDEHKIHVIAPGVEEHFHPAKESTVQDVLGRYHIQAPYILYVGSTGPHKNVETLLLAYEEACKRGGLSLALVLVVRGGVGVTVQRMVNAMSQTLKLYCLNNVPNEEVPVFYTGAMFFAWPSRYEGFGLPVLESIACGTPVLLGKHGASREIVEDDAWYVDIESHKDMAAGMCMLAQDDTRCQRLRIQGLQRAMKFSWKHSAEALRHVLYSLG